MTSLTQKVVLVLALLTALAFLQAGSKPINGEPLTPSTVAQFLDALVETEVERRLTSLLAERSLADFLKEDEFSRSSRDLIQRIAAGRQQLVGNMVRYG